MGLSKNESTILEAVSNWLQDATATADDKDKGEETSHTFTFQHETVEQEFRLQMMESSYYDGICGAFNKIHSHKYLNDPTFALSFKKEMSGQGIPEEDQSKAIDAVSEVLKSVVGEDNGEKDAGWNPYMDGIVKVSKPEQLEESKTADQILAEEFDLPQDTLDSEREFYTTKEVRSWLNGQYPNHAFWENVNVEVVPMLEELGFKFGTPEQFWEAYDYDGTDLMIRNWMHDLYESTESEYSIRG